MPAVLRVPSVLSSYAARAAETEQTNDDVATSFARFLVCADVGRVLGFDGIDIVLEAHVLGVDRVRHQPLLDGYIPVKVVVEWKLALRHPPSVSELASASAAIAKSSERCSNKKLNRFVATTGWERRTSTRLP
jgi:hypothetical protein